MTYYQTCVGICVAVIIFSMSISFVDAMNVFPTHAGFGGLSGQNTTDKVKNLTYTGWTMNDAFNLFTVGGSIAALAGAVFLIFISHSPAILGAYLFTVVFWASFLRMTGVLLLAGFLGGSVGAFFGIFTVIISVIFIGAVIGMFTGNG